VRFRLKLKFIWRLEQGQHTSAPSAGASHRERRNAPADGAGAKESGKQGLQAVPEHD
jgi:hypothetical protein